MNKLLLLIRIIRTLCTLNMVAGFACMLLGALATEPGIGTVLISVGSALYALFWGWLHDKFETARCNIESGRWKGC